MHHQRSRTYAVSAVRRRLLRQSAWLPGDFRLRESPKKEECVGRAFVWGGQRVAWDEKVPTAEAREGEHRSFADRLRPKREATAGLRRPHTEEADAGSGPAPADYHWY